MSALDWAAELSTDLGGDGTFPFVEDENANVTGYGHQDRDEFAAALNRYDEVCGGAPIAEDDLYTADDITHRWGVPYVPDGADQDEWRIHPSPKDAPGAIALTTVWGQR